MNISLQNNYSQIENGKVYSWGDNYYGQLGLGHNKNVLILTSIKELNDEKIKRIFIGGYHNFCLNGNFILWNILQLKLIYLK